MVHAVSNSILIALPVGILVGISQLISSSSIAYPNGQYSKVNLVRREAYRWSAGSVGNVFLVNIQAPKHPIPGQDLIFIESHRLRWL